MKIDDTKYEFFHKYFIMNNNKICEFKPFNVHIHYTHNGNTARHIQKVVLYDGYLNGIHTKDVSEELIFPTKEDLIKSL